MDPKVSIIIRSTDRASLAQALDSVAAQTYPNIEVVLVNAKGAGHRDLPDRCGAFPLRMVAGDGALSRTRAANTGLDAAGGDYLIFLDDDDWFEAGHIEKLVRALQANPGVLVVYSEARCIDENDAALPKKFATAYDATQLVAGNYIPIHAALFDRKLLALGCRVDESLSVYEDWDFWLQAAKFTDFKLVEGDSAVYRITQQSGFGVNAEREQADQASLLVFKKWWPEITETQILEIMDMVRLFPVRNQQIATLHQHIGEMNRIVAHLNTTIAELNYVMGLNVALQNELDGLRASTSWRVTKPLRFVGHQVKRVRHLLRLLPTLLRHGGGVSGTLSKAWRILREEGWRGAKRRLIDVQSLSEADDLGAVGDRPADRNDYGEWVERYDSFDEETRQGISERIAAMAHPPLISVLMPVYNPPLELLDAAIVSVRQQLYPHWELCIADDASDAAGVHELLQRHAAEDARIRLLLRPENGHISQASNSALALAQGEFVALLDNDDLLAEHALYCIAEAIMNSPGAVLIYSDEDKVDLAGKRYAPYFKPDWNPDLFLSHNMICHLGAYKTELVKSVGGFRVGYEGAQDYDLALRCIERLAPWQIVHIPRVLYHWRSHPGSTALSGDQKNYAQVAGQKALDDHFARTGIRAKSELLDFGMYRARYETPQPAPLVSLIIPTRNGLQLLKMCIDSIVAKTQYPNYEILIIDNGSDDPNTLAYMAQLQDDSRIRVLRDERPFNYSALNNAAVDAARGEYVALINNDIEVISPDWLQEMLSLAAQPGVGVVGACLWYPNDTLQHGGCIVGIGGVAGHSHKRLPRGQFGYFARARLIQTLSAVSAACLLVKKSIFVQVGGLDAVNLAVAFNDIDFCLKVREAGYRNVWTPYAEMYHHESATRGYEDTPEKKLRFSKEVRYMQQRWGALLRNDPAYSPNLALNAEDFSLAWPPRVPPLAQLARVGL